MARIKSGSAFHVFVAKYPKRPETVLGAFYLGQVIFCVLYLESY